MNIRKNIKNILLIIGLGLLIFWLNTKMLHGELDFWYWIFILLPIVIFSFNFLVRESPKFRPYFLSKWNFLTSKYWTSIPSDIPKELMFHKMLEVLKDSGLKVKNVDEENLEILATNTISIWSWGENIYIDFEDNGNQTVMNFYSTTVVGIISWGQNEKNYNRLLSRFEDSLTI